MNPYKTHTFQTLLHLLMNICVTFFFVTHACVIKKLLHTCACIHFCDSVNSVYREIVIILPT